MVLIYSIMYNVRNVPQTLYHLLKKTGITIKPKNYRIKIVIRGQSRRCQVTSIKSSFLSFVSGEVRRNNDRFTKERSVLLTNWYSPECPPDRALRPLTVG